VESLDVDVLIVGAGLSGIDMACRLTRALPDHTFAILEARDAIGGTWDLFRYPGVRSDSDMYTLSFPFRPWTREAAISEGGAIRDYIRETATEFGIAERVRFDQRVVGASWSSITARWTVRVETSEGEVGHTCRFLHLATGYYDYDSGHVVDFPGQEAFSGAIVHPQFWPADLEVAGRRVVVIGSGATAVTIVPALAGAGAQVVMLQRSPSYLASRPGTDALARTAFRVLPDQVAHRVLRSKNIALTTASYMLMRRFPRGSRALLTKGVARLLPDGYAVGQHFAPSYDPWDQRLCLVPDGDFFEAISSGRAEVVTDTIDTFTPDGIRTASGRDLDADIVVTATGLRLVVAGKIALDVDGQVVDLHERFVYRGLMFSDVPNLAWVVGYTNNSWTLRADLAARWICRLLASMQRAGQTTVTPRHTVEEAGRPAVDLTSGYVQRAAGILPKQGAKRPWSVRQNYLIDRITMSGNRFDDGHLQLT